MSAPIATRAYLYAVSKSCFGAAAGDGPVGCDEPRTAGEAAAPLIPTAPPSGPSEPTRAGRISAGDGVAAEADTLFGR